MVGDKAPDFALSTVQGKTVRLSEVAAKGPVVLVVLRGYPGYQCPYCNRQVQDFISKSQGFIDAGARVILVYPGPPDDLAAKATEFTTGKMLPESFDLLIDPGYELGVATLERRSMARGIGGADPVRCGIPSSDQSRWRGRWL